MSLGLLARKSEAAAPTPKGKVPTSRLRIGEPNDSFEQEADRVADEVISRGRARPEWSLSKMGVAVPPQRKSARGESSGTEESEEKRTIEHKALRTSQFGEAPPIVHEVLGSPGRPLDLASRNFFEPRFGRDFSHVRVHSDLQAAESATAVDALAYTVGDHVIFGEGKHIPDSAEGRKLLAHELAHTVQQRFGEFPPRGRLKVSEPNDSLEVEANNLAKLVGEVGIAAGQAGTGGQQGEFRLLRQTAQAPTGASALQGAAPRSSGLRSEGLTAGEKAELDNLRKQPSLSEAEANLVGILIDDETGKRYPVASGEHGGPIAGIHQNPKGKGTGYDSYTATHVEGHAADIMRKEGIKKATLLIPKEPCRACDASVKSAAKVRTPNISAMLPQDTRLTVVFDDSASTYWYGPGGHVPKGGTRRGSPGAGTPQTGRRPKAGPVAEPSTKGGVPTALQDDPGATNLPPSTGQGGEATDATMPARGPKEDVAGPVSGVGTKNTSFGATGEPPRSAGGESVGDEPPGTASHGAPAVPALGTKPNSPLAAPGEEEVIPHGALGPDAPNPGVGPARGQAEAETAGGSIGKSLKSLGQSLKADVVQGAVTFGAGVLKSYFVNKIDEKNIREGINEKWPEVQRQIRIFSPRIAALKDASPEKIYAVIKVTVVRGRVFWPGQLAESLGEVTESLAQVENVSVTEVGTAEKIEAEHSVPVEGILSMAFTHKTEFTFSILLWDRNAGVIGGSR